MFVIRKKKKIKLMDREKKNCCIQFGAQSSNSTRQKIHQKMFFRAQLLWKIVLPYFKDYFERKKIKHIPFQMAVSWISATHLILFWFRLVLTLLKTSKAWRMYFIYWFCAFHLYSSWGPWKVFSISFQMFYLKWYFWCSWEWGLSYYLLRYINSHLSLYFY